MTTQKDNQTERNTSKNASDNQSKGKQGFASMPKEQVREIAAEGGRHSHDNDAKRNNNSNK